MTTDVIFLTGMVMTVLAVFVLTMMLACNLF
jgi:hypothetical protein